MKNVISRSFFLLLALAVLAPAALSQTAVLRPGDTFDLRMTGIPDPQTFGVPFAGTWTIADDGTVGIPLLKAPVKAAGLTAAGLEKSIDERLVAEKIFTHPLAVVSLPVQSRRVTLGGPGMRQGTAIEWSPDLTLSSAINRAGGFSEYGNRKKIKVTRDGKSQVFNLARVDKDPNQNPKLLPGDEVEVPE